MVFFSLSWIAPYRTLLNNLELQRVQLRNWFMWSQMNNFWENKKIQNQPGSNRNNKRNDSNNWRNKRNWQNWKRNMPSPKPTGTKRINLLYESHSRPPFCSQFFFEIFHFFFIVSSNSLNNHNLYKRIIVTSNQMILTLKKYITFLNSY